MDEQSCVSENPALDRWVMSGWHEMPFILFSCLWLTTFSLRDHILDGRMSSPSSLWVISYRSPILFADSHFSFSSKRERWWEGNTQAREMRLKDDLLSYQNVLFSLSLMCAWCERDAWVINDAGEVFSLSHLWFSFPFSLPSFLSVSRPYDS